MSMIAGNVSLSHILCQASCHLMCRLLREAGILHFMAHLWVKCYVTMIPHPNCSYLSSNGSVWRLTHCDTPELIILSGKNTLIANRTVSKYVFCSWSILNFHMFPHGDYAHCDMNLLKEICSGMLQTAHAITKTPQHFFCGL